MVEMAVLCAAIAVMARWAVEQQDTAALIWVVGGALVGLLIGWLTRQG